MDGVLITSHGKTYKHIWAYAPGYERVPTDRHNNNHICPCANLMALFPTIVIVELIVTLEIESSTLHHCGLVNALHQITVAPIVECHGSVGLHLFPLLITLRYVIVIIIYTVAQKIQPWD